MRRSIQSEAALAVLLILGGAVCVAQDAGQATYKAKCQMCHGASGMADSPAGKAMKVKPVTDPDVKKFTEDEMVTATKNGMGKMQPYKDKLTEAEIKDAVKYFRTFLK